MNQNDSHSSASFTPPENFQEPALSRINDILSDPNLTNSLKVLQLRAWMRALEVVDGAETHNMKDDTTFGDASNTTIHHNSFLNGENASTLQRGMSVHVVLEEEKEEEEEGDVIKHTSHSISRGQATAQGSSRCLSATRTFISKTAEVKPQSPTISASNLHGSASFSLSAHGSSLIGNRQVTQPSTKQHRTLRAKHSSPQNRMYTSSSRCPPNPLELPPPALQYVSSRLQYPNTCAIPHVSSFPAVDVS